MTPQNPWHARAEELADWALARFFVRRDRYGGYYTADGETRKCSRPTKGPIPNVVSRSVLLRHFRATRTDDVCGAYSLSAEPSTGRVVSIDIDAHDAKADPDANARLGVELYGRLVEYGFRPLLARWGGSVHLHALFAADQPGTTLFQFGRLVVGESGVESYPKQASTVRADGSDGFGNWLRVVGRHHTRNQWASIYDGRGWLDGAPAVAHLLGLTGDHVDLTARAPDPEPEPEPAPSRTAPRPDRGPDVLAEYCRSTTLDEVVGWHESHGHRVVRRGADRVELVRDGKKGGQSFNVQVCGGVPITYNFSSNAGIPAAKGLNPAQLRCWYETGSCDAAALCRFADGLRAALGLPPRRRAVQVPVEAPAVGSGDDRIAALEARCAQLESDNRELARAVVALQRQSAWGGSYRVGTKG